VADSATTLYIPGAGGHDTGMELQATRQEGTMHTIFVPREQTNPRAHNSAPYALRYSANRPEGQYDTIEEAVSAARPGASIVTADGWWIVGYVQ